MKVIFSIPAYLGTLESECVLSLLGATRLLKTRGIEYEVNIISGCPVLPVARNTLTAMFMNGDGTDLFFIDSDVGFNPGGVIKILEREEKVVAGIYPLKRHPMGYPVQVKTEDGIPIGRDGLIEADFLPAGFMRIKRTVIERMQKAYPDLKYKANVVDVINSGVTEAYDFFNMGVMDNQTWTSEDFFFCKRWRDIGGQLWVYPNIDFKHVGRYNYEGNYHKYLLARPKNVVYRMREDDLSLNYLLNELPIENGIMAEIGSYAGESTEQFALSGKFSEIYAIDTWNADIPDLIICTSDMVAVEEQFDLRTAPYNSIRKVKKPSIDAVNDFPDNYFDLVYIDANHSYKSVTEDILKWLPKVKQDGIISGHDYPHFEGVKQAVDEIFGSPDKTFSDYSWMVYKKSCKCALREA